MATTFYLRKIGKRLCETATLFVVCVLLFACVLQGAQKVSVRVEYYFLVSEDMQVAAGAELIRLDGGAGYVLTDNGESFAAFSVYTNRADAQKVQRRLCDSDKNTKVVYKGVSELCFVGREKKSKQVYLSALKVLEGVIYALNGCSQELEQGITQQACRGLLTTLERQMRYAGKQYAQYVPYAIVCEEGAQRLSAICSQTIFLKDVRYLMCWFSEKHLALCSAFSV